MNKKLNIVITGGSSGLGEAVIGQFYKAQKNNLIWSETEINIYNIDCQTSKFITEEKAGNFHCKDIIVNFNELHSFDYFGTKEFKDQFPEQIDILINNCGINYIEWIDKIEEEFYDALMNVNVKVPAFLAKHFCSNLKDGSILNIVSNASDLAMTNSLVYNATKGAMKIMTKQMARELSNTHNITVFGVSPNKLADTQMSRYIDGRVCELRGWSKEEAQKYQVASLPTRIETNKETLAEFIVFLLSSKERHKYLQGCCLPYGGPISN